MIDFDGPHVKAKIHDTDGTAHVVEGRLAWVAAHASQPLGPGQDKQWDCLVAVPTDTGAAVFPFNICDLEFVPPGAAEDAGARSLDEARAKIHDLDDEAARLTVELNNARAEIVRQTDEINSLREALRALEQQRKRGGKAGA